MKNNKSFLIIFISLVFIIITSIYFFTKDTNKVTLDTNTLFFNNTISEEIDEEKIAIHITGEINSPGIIYLNSSSRIADAINIAGGTTNLADLSKVNLAYELKDGQKIYIPSIYDEEETNYISDNAGDNVLESSAQDDNGIININSATQSELETLPGIGETTASKIIEYRNKNGKFKTIEDIMNVSRYW